MKENSATKKPRRVLHIGKYFPPHRGGMETVLRDQMNIQTRDEGLQVAAVVHSSGRRFRDKTEVTEAGYRVRRSARWCTAFYAPISPFFWLSVMREISELNPAQITIHMPNLSAFWLLFMSRAKTRNWVIFWHSDVIPSKFSVGLNFLYQLYKPLETLLLKRASRIIVTSPPYLEYSAPLSQFRHKCVVEPLELDHKRIPEHFLIASKRPKYPCDHIRVLCVGRLTYYKGFDTAIRAVGEISNAELRIVGDGQLRSKLEDLITELKLESRVKLLGQIDDHALWEQYLWCDVHCLPSIDRAEAFGLSVTEAALFNRPSIVSKLAGSGLEWNAQQTGLPYEVASPGSAEDFGECIKKLFNKCS